MLSLAAHFCLHTACAFSLISCAAPLPTTLCIAELLLSLRELCSCVARLEVQAGRLGVPIRDQHRNLTLGDYVEQLVLGAPRGCANRIILLVTSYRYFAPVSSNQVLRAQAAVSLQVAAAQAAVRFHEEGPAAAQAAQLWDNVAQAAAEEFAALELPPGGWYALPFAPHEVCG